MKPQSSVLVMALLTASALSYGQAVTPGGPQDYQAMMKAMEKAQAEANQPGDERLTCTQLQELLVGIAQDPAFAGAREGRRDCSRAGHGADAGSPE